MSTSLAISHNLVPGDAWQYHGRRRWRRPHLLAGLSAARLRSKRLSRLARFASRGAFGGGLLAGAATCASGPACGGDLLGSAPRPGRGRCTGGAGRTEPPSGRSADVGGAGPARARGAAGRPRAGRCWFVLARFVPPGPAGLQLLRRSCQRGRKRSRPGRVADHGSGRGCWSRFWSRVVAVAVAVLIAVWRELAGSAAAGRSAAPSTEGWSPMPSGSPPGWPWPRCSTGASPRSSRSSSSNSSSGRRILLGWLCWL